MSSNSQKSLIWVIATLAIAMLPQLRSMPGHLALLAILPLVWRLAAELRGWRPIAGWLRVALTLTAVFLLAATYGGLLGRRAAVGLLTLMLALKLLETFRIRDARIVTSLALFLCATQFLFSQGIVMLLYAAASVISALVALALLHRREAFRSVGEAPPSGQSLMAEIGFTLRLLAMATPAALAVFLLFPRWSSPLWGVPEEALDSRSGLSGNMSPGSIQNLFMDDSPAFRATFEGPLPPNSALYWRGPVFWDFDGRTWTGMYFARGLPAESQPQASSAPWRYQVQLEPHEQHWIFALDYPAMVPNGVRLTMDYQLLSRRAVTALRSYPMASDPDFTDSPRLRPTFRQAALELPPDFNPRTRELVQRWRRETPDDRQLVERVLSHFNREPFRYTLNPPLLSRHSVDEFLFDTRSGFCEHYASAFTVMMRMAGVPARVVTGYQGGWYNEVGRYVLVRQSDAHAWSEVWLPGAGWTRVDPTAAVAPSRIDGGALEALAGPRYAFDFAWVRDMRNGFDLLQRRWNDWVIAFNAERQSRLFTPLGLGPLDTPRLVGLMLLAALLGSLAVLPALLRMRSGRKTDPVIRAWQRFRKRLQKAGVTLSPGVSPMELAGLAGSQMGRKDDEIRRIAWLYTLVRYADAASVRADFIRAARAFRPAAQRQNTGETR
jgi:transglutaminase-like putative cysteine protease